MQFTQGTVIKENWWVRCWPNYKRICFFLPISWLYHSCSGRCWEPLASLAPVSFAMHLPSQGEARSWEALGASDPKLPFFFPVVEKLDLTFGFMRLTASVQKLYMVSWELVTQDFHPHQGLPQQGFFLHTSICWKSASCEDGSPGFLALLELWGSSLLFSFLKRRHNLVFQLLISWFPVPWRHGLVLCNRKGYAFIPN